MSTRRWTKALIASVLVVLTGAIVTPAAARGAAPERPWSVVYSGTYQAGTHHCEPGFVPLDTEGSGHATHLGAVTIHIRDCVNPITGEITDGVVVYEAANGDQLFGTFEGTVLAPNPDGSLPVTVLGTYDGGTGRFTNATGQATETAIAVPTSETSGSIAGELSGTIAYNAAD